MAQLKEILETERNRNGDLTAIHLFAEGMFYRAYEWSAWLCVRYVNEFKDCGMFDLDVRHFYH